MPGFTTRPEIGVEQIGANAAHRTGIDDRREGGVDVFEQADACGVEPARPIGRPSDHRKPLEGVVERQCEIIGGAGVSEL